MRKLFTTVIGIALSLLLCTEGACQNDMQVGVGFRLTGELLYSGRFAPELTTQHATVWFNWKLALTSGINYRIKAGTNASVTPSVNVDAVIFQGGGGAADLIQLRAYEPFKRSLNKLFVFTLALQGSYKNVLGSSNWLEIQAKPAYYFSNFSNPALINPSLTSLSIGRAWVWADEWRQKDMVINASYRNLQLQYYNDGGVPILDWLGDGKDRYFTGGIIFSYFNQQRRDMFQNIELSYHKFTAFGDNNYEIATDFSYSDVIYRPTDEAMNRSKLELKFINAEHYYGVGAVVYDKYSLDLQHGIHFLRYFSHHISPYPVQFGLTGFGQFTDGKQF